MILVTGGAGFIGANFVLDWLDCGDEPVVNLDKLTYAGNLGNLASLKRDGRHVFVRGDIGDRELVLHLLSVHRPRAIVISQPRPTSIARFTGPQILSPPILSAHLRCSTPRALIGLR
jgi:dTDP-D-glucose 4,6-dehydratase